MAQSHRLAVLTLLVALPLLTTDRAAAEEDRVGFNRQIRTILSNHCYQCHGPDAAQRAADLRLDSFDGATKPLDSGFRAIAPGDPAGSELVKRIHSTDPDTLMPPPSMGKPLSDEQKALLERWIAEGAQYEGHWAFLPPARLSPPEVKQESAVVNEIDRFIIKKLESEGLSASPEAAREQLIRRVTLDLTGLPPTPEEVDAFLADQSPDAYERVVDRLLLSHRYGEHMARYWLDAARYGDTHGLHLDNERSLWPYRNWVVTALNENMPFDRFTIEQLAGDLLPQPTRDQRIATGFIRCNVTTGEGGSIDEEVLVRYAVDRTETMGTVWMGLTLNCSVCHSHKFDPITQKDFYSLYAFFNSLADNAMDGNVLLPPPVLQLPSAEQTASLAALETQRADLERRINESLESYAYVEPNPSQQPLDALSVLRRELVWIEDAPPSGVQLNTAGHEWRYNTRGNAPVYSGDTATTRTADGLAQHFFEGANPPLMVGAGDTLFAYVYIDPANLPQSIMLQFHSPNGGWEHRGFWGADVIPFGTAGTPGHVHRGALPPAGEWVRLEVDAATAGLPAGSQIDGWAFTQFGGTVHWDHAGVMTRSPQAPVEFESLLAWSDSVRANPANLPAPVQEVLKVAPEARSPEQAKTLRNYYLRYVHGPAKSLFGPLDSELTRTQGEIAAIQTAIPATMVAEDLATPRDAFVLIRGAYDKKGDKVERAVPAAFPPLPDGAPRNRLGLAQWLVSPQHPLTARVVINRYWQQFFGVGIVKTAEDFGSQGDWPSHPELLDWLATEFVRTGWDIKRMHKLMVMSGTYRQSSRVSPELVARDPENRLLGRGPRFRVDAEVIRDSLLSISGLLVERSADKSLRIPQPDGLWEAVGFVGSNTREFKVDVGDAVYRRSLYTFWKRTSPPPVMQTLDAPSRENCTVRRPRTNTPLQALLLMNEQQSLEAARQLARRLLLTQPNDAERLVYGFRLITARKPSASELAVLERSLGRLRERYTQDPAAAEQLLSTGVLPRDTSLPAIDHATWTMLCNLMLNLDEAVTKE